MEFFITILQNFYIHESNVYVNSVENTQGICSWFMYSDVSEPSIAGNSVLRDFIVQELAQRSLERISFN